ncbi:hypothetical protein N7504_011903 [Penicillium tannophilum]|nr:hypothetical protein N7504_011903 [Penicillium tannophilum]
MELLLSELIERLSVLHFKGARNRLPGAIIAGTVGPEPVRPLYVPPPPPPPAPLHSRVFASIALLHSTRVRSGLSLVRAVDGRCRGVMGAAFELLPARPALVLPFSPVYVVAGASDIVVYRDLARDNRDMGLSEAGRPLLVYLRLLSPTRSLIRGFFEDGIQAFLDSPRLLRALARLPPRFMRAAALMRPLMTQLGVSLGLLPEPPASVPVWFYRWLVQSLTYLTLHSPLSLTYLTLSLFSLLTR